MSLRRRKLLLSAFGALAVVVLIGLWVNRDYPDTARARRDFLAEHPGAQIERVSIDEREVAAATFRITYRKPGDPTLHEELRQYIRKDGRWRATSGEEAAR